MRDSKLLGDASSEICLDMETAGDIINSPCAIDVTHDTT